MHQEIPETCRCGEELRTRHGGVTFCPHCDGPCPSPAIGGAVFCPRCRRLDHKAK